MLPDSGHIQEQEIEWRNRKRMREGKEALPPLYTAQDAIDTMEIFKPVNYDEIIEIDPNIYVRFNDAGHMLISNYRNMGKRRWKRNKSSIYRRPWKQ